MNSPANQPVSSEPRENSRSNDPAVPVWLIVVLFLLVFWGAVYFDEHGGWFHPQVYGPYVSAEQLTTYQVSAGPDIFAQGKAVYDRTCIACHQASGQGAPGTFPPLAGSDWVNEQEPGRMIRIVLQGFSGPGLKINGQPFNTGSAMVPWNGLSDDDLAAVISFVRGNKEWGNHAPPVTPEQVHAIRAKVQSAHPMSFSPDEIEKISPSE